MAKEIILETEQISAEALLLIMEEEVRHSDIRLMIERTRSFEAAVLVAIVGASGTALGALITGVLRVAVQKGAQTIVIHGRSGRKLEVPANISKDQLDELVQVAKELDSDRIIF